MRRCRSRPQQIWYNVLGLYGSLLAFRVSNTKRHNQNCISERVSDPNSALNGFSSGKSLLFRLLAHCSHTLTVQSVCILVFWAQLYPTSASHIHRWQMYPEHKLLGLQRKQMLAWLVMADSCSQGHWESTWKLGLLLRPLPALSQQLRRYQESR